MSISTKTQFEEDVVAGLSATRKRLPSKYFYDAKGDKLFQQIMQLPEYYLTNKEKEIFESQKDRILDAFGRDAPFRIIELGAGDGTKTKVLLKHFVAQGIDFTYCPIDISSNVLDQLEDNLIREIPNLQMSPYAGDYFDGLEEIAKQPGKDIVFFLGSNIGNFGDGGDVQFLSKLNSYLMDGDMLFMGADLKKDPSIILAAYNDSQGITKEFNLNLLDRINHELGGNFDRDQFQHYPYYNPQTGECRSYLISKIAQEVQVADQTFCFEPWEAIFMEISKKFSFSGLSELAEKSRFAPQISFTDSEQRYADVLWMK